jgi:hypothetical protein
LIQSYPSLQLFVLSVARRFQNFLERKSISRFLYSIDFTK